MQRERERERVYGYMGFKFKGNSCTGDEGAQRSITGKRGL
jgi:hypothetical protein